MTEGRNTLTELIVACWKDDSLMERLKADPRTVLGDNGLDVPGGIQVEVVENTDSVLHITMPAKPSNVMSLTDAELTEMAGGAAQCCGSVIVANAASN